MNNLEMIEFLILTCLIIAIGIWAGRILTKALKREYAENKWVRWLINLWWLLAILGLLFG